MQRSMHIHSAGRTFFRPGIRFDLIEFHAIDAAEQTDESVRINEFVGSSSFFLHIILSRQILYLYIMFNVPHLMFILSSYLWANCRWFFFSLAATQIVSKKRRKKNIFCSLMSEIADQTMTSYWDRNDILHSVCVMSNRGFQIQMKVVIIIILLSFWSTHKRIWVKYRCIFSHLFEKLQCPEEAHCLNGRSMD